jgi:hypothetical protein
MGARNALAVALAPHAPLPPMLGRSRDCLRCGQLDTCMILHRVRGGRSLAADQTVIVLMSPRA